MGERAKRAIRFLVTSAFGLVSVGAVFTALTGMIAGSGGSPLARSEPRRIVFEFTPPAEPPEIALREKAEREEWERLPQGEFTGPGPCLDCSREVAPRPVIDLTPFARGSRALPRIDGAQGIDADPQPIVRIPPEYPMNARGDGFVLVQFDISPAGTVENARAIDSAPRGMFEKSALNAIVRWRYRPAVVEGRAVERRGIRVRLRFELERA